MLLFAGLILTNPSYSQSIFQVTNLLEDARNSSWDDGKGNSLNVDEFGGIFGSVFRGKRPIILSDSSGSPDGELNVNQALSADALDIEFAPTFGRADSVVRGSYVVNLPDVKRVQLEAAVDLMVDSDGERSPAAVGVEILERSKMDQNVWEKTGGKNGVDFTLDANTDRISRIQEQRFTTHSFVVDLSKWRGKEIRLDLVTRVSKRALTPQKARWITARIIGADFNYILGPIINDTSVIKTKTRSSRDKEVKPNTDVELGGYTSILIKSATNIPDTPISTVRTYGEGSPNPYRWFGYFHGIMEKEGADAVSPIDRRGTMAFDLKNYTSSNLYNISVSNLQNTLLRGTSQAAASPAVSGTPFLVIKPHAGEWDEWDNWYTGVCSNILQTTDTKTRVHAFVHVEDKSRDGIVFCPTAYIRIGYARSAENHAYDFDLNNNGTYLMSDSGVGSSTPIIEAFIKEGKISGRRGSNGAGSPSVIKSGDYLYLYYSRQLGNCDVTPEYGGYWPIYTTTIASATNIYWDNICAARAPVNQVINEGYANLPNPWKNFYNGSWNEAGRNGYSTPVIPSTENHVDSWRAFSKVVHDTANGRFYMICGGEYGLYLYDETSDLSTGNWGTGMLLDGMEKGAAPSLIGDTGDDKEGNGYYMLYYAWKAQKDDPLTMRRRSIFIDK